MYPQFNIDRYIPHIYMSSSPFVFAARFGILEGSIFLLLFFSSYLILFQTKSEECLIIILIVVSLSLSYTFLRTDPLYYNIINIICSNYSILKNLIIIKRISILFIFINIIII